MPLLDRQRGLLDDASVGYLHGVLPHSLRHGLPPIGERWGGFGESSTVDVRERVLGALDLNAWLAAVVPARGQKRTQFLGFLRSLRPPAAGQRVLYVEHALLPHGPATFLPSGREYESATTAEVIYYLVDGARRSFSSTQALQHHLLQVGYVDRLVGVLVRRLAEAGLYDRALVVVTADHGIGFEPGGAPRSVTEENLPDIAGSCSSSSTRGNSGGSSIAGTPRRSTSSRRSPTSSGHQCRGTSTAGRFAASRSDGECRCVGPGAVGRRHLRTRSQLGCSPPHSGTQRCSVKGRTRCIASAPITSCSVARSSGRVVPHAGARKFAWTMQGSSDDVRTDSLFSPSHVAGAIQRRSLALGTPVAIAVNGQVAATTRTFGLNGTRLSALVPERVLVDGKNSVTVYTFGDVAVTKQVALLARASSDL